MPKKPNYAFERMERQRLKDAKKAEKAEARTREREQEGGESPPEGDRS
jgi:hypothetical protein